MILDDGIDILVMTETWLYAKGDEACIAEMDASVTRGYALRSFPRTGSRGGGIAFILRGTLSVTVHLSNACPFTESFEAVELHIRNFSVSVVCPLYRPPPSRKNKLSNQLFLQEFPEFLTQFAGSHSDCLAILTFITMTANHPVDHLKTMLSDHGLTQLSR